MGGKSEICDICDAFKHLIWHGSNFKKLIFAFIAIAKCLLLQIKLYIEGYKNQNGESY